MIRAQKLQTKRISCKGHPPLCQSARGAFPPLRSLSSKKTTNTVTVLMITLMKLMKAECSRARMLRVGIARFVTVFLLSGPVFCVGLRKLPGKRRFLSPPPRYQSARGASPPRRYLYPYPPSPLYSSARGASPRRRSLSSKKPTYTVAVLMMSFNEVDESRMQPCTDAAGRNSAFRYSFLDIWTRFLCGSEKAPR